MFFIAYKPWGRGHQTHQHTDQEREVHQYDRLINIQVVAYFLTANIAANLLNQVYSALHLLNQKISYSEKWSLDTHM